MPATAADIAAATRAAQIVNWSDAAVKTRYPTARDGATDAAEGFFDDPNDAQSVLTARAALIGTERRRLSLDIADLLWLDPAAGSLTATVVDVEQVVNGSMLTARLQVDLEAETSTIEVFG